MEPREKLAKEYGTSPCSRPSSSPPNRLAHHPLIEEEHRMAPINYLAVLVSALVLFVLGGVWFSGLFSKPWRRMMGVTGPMQSPGVALFAQFFVCALFTSIAMAVVLAVAAHMQPIELAVACWLGFAGATSYSTAKAGKKPTALWAIESGYNLVSFIIAAVILSAWH